MNTVGNTSSAQPLKKTGLEEFDLVILGGGTGSTIAAWTFAKQGQRVAIVDRILGFTAFGVGAGEIMSAVQIAMIAGLPYTALRNAILTHPTLTEGLGALFSSAPSIPKSADENGKSNVRNEVYRPGQRLIESRLTPVETSAVPAGWRVT